MSSAPVHRFLLLAAVLAGTASSACDFLWWKNDDSRQARLDRARTNWRSEARTSYRFDFQWSCYCPPEFTSPVRVTVTDGVVTRVTDRRDGTVYANEPYERWKTVEGLFDVMQEAIDDGVDTFWAEYDDATGLPIEFDSNPDDHVSDGGLGFRAGALDVD